ncbi:GumC family protein [Microbulbifer mangrovi]|uniref:GumC family protein n=1 Tax=Microbulbifer mangrovi TaxID=927787 RepID=UPI00099083B4|nr:hypothetical protein [Microbulbifer mangrovi]
MMGNRYELSLTDYFGILKRRWPIMAGPFLFLFSLTIIISLNIPPTFRSEGTILIESQKIPDDLIRSTVTSYADERIQVIQQLVMTRDHLLRIIEKYDLFSDIRNSMSVSEQIDLIREKITITKVTGDAGSSRGRTTLAFKVGFESNSPKLSHSVANELVTLFLEENVKARTRRASETTQFLTQEAGKLKSELESIEEKIATYKQEYSDSLPEHLDLHIKMLERAEASILSQHRDIKAAGDELRFLQLEKTAIQRGASQNTQSAAPVTREQALTAAQDNLARLKARYSPQHPDVVRQQHQIDKIRMMTDRAITEQSPDNLIISSVDLDSARVGAKIASAIEKEESLQRELEQLVNERDRLENIIIQTPQVQRALTSLNRNYDNTLKKYKEIQSKEIEAKIAESLEEAKKAERFSVLEPPVQPEKPIKPNRKKIAAAGFVFAMAAAIALAVLLEFKNGRLFGSRPLTQLLGEKPLVIIPYIATSKELAHAKMVKRGLLAGGALTTVTVLVGIHFLFMPLDIFMFKLLAKIG